MSISFMVGLDKHKKLWQADLSYLTENVSPHLSLYNLTYELGTPIGRAQKKRKNPKCYG